uniref:B9 domain-containing protein 1 n=1 Tax=Steinernema glaseri TaxID=37863 RepID=A0A1I7ZIP7_9BILA
MLLSRHKRTVAMFVPEASTSIQKVLGLLSGRRPEFVDPKIVATHEGREATRVSTQGLITVSFNVMLKDIRKAGYDVFPSTSRFVDMPSTRELQEEGILRPNPNVATVAPQISTADLSNIAKIEEEEEEDSLSDSERTK